MREYSPTDGSTKVELKSDLKPGLYETRNGKLYLIEQHDDGGKSAVDAAADKFAKALSRLIDE